MSQSKQALGLYRSGELILTTSAVDYPRTTQSVSIRAGDTTIIDLPLTPAAAYLEEVGGRLGDVVNNEPTGRPPLLPLGNYK